MSGKIDLYNLGENGINVSVSPIHTKPGDLLQGQNAVPDPAGAEGGLRKRGGLTKLNSVALSGAVKGIGFVPFDSEAGSVSGQTGDLTQTLYVGITSGSNFWRTSTNGTTWANATSPTRTTISSGNIGARPLLSLNNRLYYMDVDGDFREWDGTTDRQLARLPANPLVTSALVVPWDLVVHNGKAYLAKDDGADGSGNEFGRVLEIDLTTGAVRQVGEMFGTISPGLTLTQYPKVLLSYAGRLWAAAVGAANNDTRIYWIRPEVDEAWTLDQAYTTTGYPSGMAAYAGDLFVGTARLASGTAAVVYRRTPTGTWSTSETGSVTTTRNGYAGLITLGSSLYALYGDDTTGSTVMLVRTFNGTSWSTDADLYASLVWTTRVSQALVIGSDLYVVGRLGSGTNTQTVILRRSGGAWTSVENHATLHYMGLGFIRS